MTDPRWITEADVTSVVDIRAATTAVAQMLVHQHHGSAQTLDKTALTWGGGSTLHALGGVAGDVGSGSIAGTKTWAHTPGGATPLLVLWDASDGTLLAVVEAFALGQLRTASISAVATGHLARRDATVMAMIGTGKQALAQVAAVASVRELRRIQVHSPTATHRDAFVDRLEQAGAAPQIVACDSVAEAVASADIVTTATRSREPILEAGHLGPEAHVNALGAITPERRELGADVAAAASLVVSDSPTAAGQLSSELDGCDVVALDEIVGRQRGRRPEGLTVFKAMGLGLADVAVGLEVLRRAAERGLGRPVPAPTRAQPTLFTRRPSAGRAQPEDQRGGDRR
jgi:alanine dehydrogenase